MKPLAIALLCALSVSAAQASVVVGGTRVIFDGQQKAATLSVQNKDKTANPCSPRYRLSRQIPPQKTR